MATYAQILKSTAQGRRQRWFIAGTVPALVQDAYELALAHVYSVNVPVTKTVLLGAEASLREIEYELTRDHEGERLVVVLHEAEKFQEWDELVEILQEQDVTRFFIAVSHAEPPETKDTWAKAFVGSQKARFVVCNEMTPTDKSTWVQSRLNITQEAEDYLIQRSWGDYEWLLNQIRKLEFIEVDTVGLKLVQIICSSHGTPNFVDQLGRGESGKIPALVSLHRGGVSSNTLNDLTRHLTNLIHLHDESRSVGPSPRLLTERTGLSPKQVSVYKSSAVYYDLQAAARCFTTLSRLYEGLRRCNRTAYLALVTRW